MRRFILLFISTICCFAAALPQQPQFNIRRYSTDNGLPANGIKGIQWDEKTGFLWIATEAGVSRFNGTEFKNFTRDNTSTITAERMLFLIRNNSGKIYTADQARNIFSIKDNLLQKENRLTGAIDKVLFLLAVSDTFFINNLKQEKTIPFFLTQQKNLALTDTSCFTVNNGSLLYYSISMPAYIRINTAEVKAKNIFKIGGTGFISSTDNKIYKINENTKQLLPVSFLNEILLKNEDRVFWNHTLNNPVILNKNEAFVLEYENGRLVKTPICNNVPVDAFIDYAEYSKKQRMLFLGTNSKGIIIISENKVLPVKFNSAGTIQRNAYYSQIELPSGNILTNEGHVLGFNQPLKNQVAINGKIGVLVSRSGDSVIWYSQSIPELNKNLLHSYNIKTGRVKRFEKINGLELTVYSNNTNTYMATERGIGILQADSLYYRVKNSEGNYNSTIFDISETSPGYLLLASCSGLLGFNTNSFKSDTLFSSEGNCVRTLWKYKEYVFFGTYGKGFYVMKNGRIKAMPLDKNNFLAYTHCFMPDAFGYCWISTNRGLFRASIEEMLHAFETGSPSVYYHYYGKNDGMEITEMNGGCKPCAIQLKNNMLSFPTMDGLLWVNPDKEGTLLPEGEIYIDEILVDGKKNSVDSFDMKTLKPGVEEINIYPAYTAWCNTENIYLEYQLNDTLKWRRVNIESGAGIPLNNLPYGTYKLRIRKINGFGINNYVYKEINFTIATPWYRRWWFALLLLVLASGFIYLLLRWHTHQLKTRAQKLELQVTEKTKELQQKNEALEKNNTIKTRLISIISHDIVTPLKFLTVAGKNLLEKRKQMPDELQQETIAEMTNTSQELQLLSTNILNWIKYQNENRRLVKEKYRLHILVNQVFGVLSSIARQKQIQLVNAVDSNLELYQYFEPLRIVLHNLVANAINFTEKGTIEISCTLDAGFVYIQVADTGVGMTPDQIQNILSDEIILSSANIDNRKGNGLGYLIIKDLVKMMQAGINIKSEKGKGTSVIIQISNNNKV